MDGRVVNYQYEHGKEVPFDEEGAAAEEKENSLATKLTQAQRLSELRRKKKQQ